MYAALLHTCLIFQTTDFNLNIYIASALFLTLKTVLNESLYILG